MQRFIPIKDAVWGLPPPLSVTESSPPPEVRNQVTVMAQDFRPAKLVLQELLWEKGPDVAISAMSSGLTPTLVKVAPLDVPQSQ